MKWLKFRLKTLTEAEDIIITELYGIGLQGAQVEDKVPLSALEKERMFVDIPPEEEEDDGTAYLSFFVEEADDGLSDKVENGTERTLNFSKYPPLLFEDKIVSAEEIRDSILDQLELLRTLGLDIGEGTLSIEETEDVDWVNNWKEYFHSFSIDDVRIVPSWEDPDLNEESGVAENAKYLLRIDPGTAFGTGAHETTQLCIRALRRYVTPETVLLDVGTGSGILAILSLMFGARHAVGTDLDPCAIDAVAENKARNGIPDADFELLIGNIITEADIQERVGTERYDIVVANILADVLVPLTPVVVQCLNEGGVYITSGIIEGKETIVKDAMLRAGLRIEEETAQGEWRCVVGRK